MRTCTKTRVAPGRRPDGGEPVTVWDPSEHGFEPLDWQERHSPTVDDEIKMGTFGRDRVIERRRRRISDTKIMQSIPDQLHDVMHDLLNCYTAFAGPMALRSMDYERVISLGRSRSGSGAVDSMSMSVAGQMRYRAWLREADCRHGDVIAVLAHGETVTEQYRRRGGVKGAVMENIIRGLEEWDRIRRNFSLDPQNPDEV